MVNAFANLTSTAKLSSVEQLLLLFLFLTKQRWQVDLEGTSCNLHID
jgi:hypothetical protein